MAARAASYTSQSPFFQLLESCAQVGVACAASRNICTEFHLPAHVASGHCSPSHASVPLPPPLTSSSAVGELAVRITRSPLPAAAPRKGSASSGSVPPPPK